MTGADIICALLGADAGFIALVPADRLKSARLPDGIALSAVVVRVVSGTERQPLKRGGSVRRTERVAVTVRAINHRDKKAVLDCARDVLRGRTGDLGGARGVSILTAGTGPDVDGPGESFEQTQDFRVSFEADA